ncbi:MAG: tRNA (N6-threonylcarbamoyladenosine(37)-N6)-methyltransferase TrmO [Ruminococcaceae bacterium]|nr:tRNA (N6-threonylcarbamoyladenosine(37)-N6)-methyltransferase TrmO [Oscillospiraceae bacterium]
MKVIARIHTEFPEKFGIPRQSGLAPTRGTVVFESPYRNPDALRGIEGFSHIWLLWEFSEAVRGAWSPTVRPPRLGGNTRMGVFATRSPFRPNPVGLSAVKLVAVRQDKQYGTVLEVEGADLMDGTPIYDIKPYLPFADSVPLATGGFADPVREKRLAVVLPDECAAVFTPAQEETLREVLAQDPRPSYQEDADRVYGMAFAGRTVRFRVAGDILTVCEVE